MSRGPETVQMTEAELRQEFGLPEAVIYDVANRPSEEAVNAAIQETISLEGEWVRHLTNEVPLVGNEYERVFMGYIRVADQPVQEFE